LAWLAWLVVHIWFLIDFRNRISVVLNWFWNYISYRRGARLITGQRPWELAERLAAPLPPSGEGPPRAADVVPAAPSDRVAEEPHVE
jgi:NADH dehydrogenase